MDFFPWLLFLHVLGAIIAFGPTFSFPIIGAMGGAERMHANFATRVSERISKVQVTPLAIFQGITGVGMILSRNIDITKTTWLLIGIILYVIALIVAIFLQAPTVRKVIALTTPPPGGGAPGGSPAGGPPPELMGLVKRIQRNGMILGLLIIGIVFLMVVKPTF